ncbi:EscR/YscR/HrcR family type III secretion system export apparatus protein [Pararobbsia silviterrae]|uniref:EscR/YscR/HrcR family type III secretion system export apparatus protein n=1 Tax=Pararobbsia silviterrae TaxID=1792498 RepID=A0A494XS25_9BURK|nr:EscR/YscR/HrcR family type III secretion system export apparatus protein [Pararobbsia silviterrae]RKP50343.1 EscR/YscR/HrcR family type III secretion system export apparatus protein [Pararobbsia silviterrae]
MPNGFELIALLSVAAMAPFIIAVGTCFIKMSVVLVLVRNAIGLQNSPSNITLNGVALLLSMFVMLPIAQDVHAYWIEHRIDVTDRDDLERFSTQGLSSYRTYLFNHARPALVAYFDGIRRTPERDVGARLRASHGADGTAAADDVEAPSVASSIPTADDRLTPESVSLFALLPAYALSELEDAFRIGFYLYLPFVVIDLVVSSILLALGMMMMSPLSISIPIKLILFIAMDGWTLLSRGLIDQYLVGP